MIFCTSAAQVRSRSAFCFKQTSKKSSKKQLIQNKSVLARSLQNHRRSGSSKGKQHGLPSKASNLTPEGDAKPLLSVETDVFFRCAFNYPYVSFSLVLFWLVRNFSKQVREVKRIFTQGWKRVGCKPDA